MNIKHCSPSRCGFGVLRRGISLMEVLFAIGVLLIGLVGLASILGVATTTAKNTLETNLADASAANQEALSTIQGSGLTAEYRQFWNSSSRFNSLPLPRMRAVERDMVVDPDHIYSLYVVDPWFLTAAETLRPDTGTPPTHNGYDRTLFPCFDDRLDVLNHGPNEAITNSPAPLAGTQDGWSPRILDTEFPDPFGPPWVHTWPPVVPVPGIPPDPPPGTVLSYPLGRRIPRIVDGDVINAKLIERMAREADRIQVIESAEAQSAGPGLAVLRGPTLAGLGRTTTRVRDTLSLVAVVDKRGAGTETTTIVYEDRQIAIDPTNDNLLLRHNLDAFTAVDGLLQSNAPVEQRNYLDERLGYVIRADDTMRNGEGQFTFAVHRSVDPSVRAGDWMMLLRRDYRFDLTRLPPRDMGDLQFAFVQVKSVDVAPILVGDIYEVAVTVSGKDWTFHPIQTYIRTLQGENPYQSGLAANPPQGYVNGSNAYDYATVTTAAPVNAGQTGQLGDPLYGTSVVLFSSVISITTQ